MNNEKKVGICGFQNIGNTCFMNSVLQLLVHCKPIIKFLHDSVAFQTYLEKASIQTVAKMERKKLNLEPNAKVSIDRTDINNLKDSAIITELAKIIESITKENEIVTARIKPVSFKEKIDIHLPAFRGFRQHDAHEFLVNILDKFFDEICITTNPNINNIPSTVTEYIQYFNTVKHDLDNAESLDSKKQIIDAFNMYKAEHYNIISKYYGYQAMAAYYKKRYNPLLKELSVYTQSTVTCSVCKFDSVVYEPTQCIQLEVTPSIQQSLEQYSKSEILDNGEKYNCAICKQKQVATKTVKIWHLPKIMFIQLKRFTQTPRGIHKNESPVEIPFSLDIAPYVELFGDDSINTKYNLIGFSNHHGGMGGGHYTADAVDLYDSKQWMHFDDSSVSKYNQNKVNTNSAYILMYEQQE